MRLMLGLPAHGGLVHFTHARGLADLATIAGRHDFPIEAFWLANESLITRGRNTCVAHFMASDCDSLMFIDSDIGFAGRDLVELLLLQAEDSRYDIIGGRYRKKNLTGDFVPSGTFHPDTREPVQVPEIGTGFMLIRRSVFERLAPTCPQYVCEIERTPMVDYFACGVCPETKRYLSEDYAFCARAASVGISTWLCPWIKLSHAGLHIFE
jgi:hypothetical protein